MKRMCFIYCKLPFKGPWALSCENVNLGGGPSFKCLKYIQSRSEIFKKEGVGPYSGMGF